MNLNLVKNLCNLPVNKLYNILVNFLHKKGYKKIYHNAHYIMAEGEIPICLVAHMDTVGEYNSSYPPDMTLYDPEEDILHVVSGCTLDDRLGIYIILNILSAGYRPSIIFTDLEESGGVGAKELVKKFPICPFKINFIIELDRQGQNDAVYYTCGNKEFQEYINSFGFETQIGTFTDCLVLGEAWDIAAVNLSCGYMWEHSIYEYAHMKWVEETENKVIEILIQDYTYLPIYSYDKEIPVYSKHFSTTGIEIGDEGEEAELPFSIDNCALCGKEIKNYNDAIYYNCKDYNYCICNNCAEKYDINDGDF